MSENRRIAKNAMMLYLRMFISVIVSLYTSRIVLQVLGVEDYGVYNVVGGVVAMLSFLNASMSGATSRFLNIELGRGSEESMKDTFASALIVHIGIALIAFIATETVGYYFVTHKLVIAPERMQAAFWVYQFSILSMIVGVIRVPYMACVMAHERMSFYAYMDLLNVFLKLGAIFILQVGEADKLILYAILVLGVEIVTTTLYYIYSCRNFLESRFNWTWRPETLRSMLSFSSWSIMGSLSDIGSTQGNNFLLNFFFGTALNAANGIAITVQGILKAFAFNVITAFRPQVVQRYAEGQIDSMQTLMEYSALFATATYALLGIPLFFEADYVLHLWLGVVPPYTSLFLRLTLIANVIAINYTLFSVAIGAVGKVKWLNIASSTSTLLPLAIIYTLYRCDGRPVWGYVFSILSAIAIFIANFVLMKHYIPMFQMKKFFRKTLLSQLLPVTLSLGTGLLITYYMEESFIRLLVTIMMTICVFASSLYFLAFSNKERALTHSYVAQRLTFLFKRKKI